MPQTLDTQIEALIDSYSIRQVLYAIGRICDEKSAYVANTPSHGDPSPSLAREWDRIGDHLGRLATENSSLAVGDTMPHTNTQPEPYESAKIGDSTTIYGIRCTVFALHPAGTVDVIATDGSDRCWRISGGIVRVPVVS